MATLKAFITAHWKALMPLVAFVASQVIASASSVDTPHGWKGLALTLASSVLVWLKANTGPKALPAQARDAGQVGISLLLRIVALVCLVVFTLIAHGTFTSDEGMTWLGAGLVFWLLAELVP